MKNQAVIKRQTALDKQVEILEQAYNQMEAYYKSLDEYQIMRMFFHLFVYQESCIYTIYLYWKLEPYGA